MLTCLYNTGELTAKFKYKLLLLGIHLPPLWIVVGGCSDRFSVALYCIYKQFFCADVLLLDCPGSACRSQQNGRPVVYDKKIVVISRVMDAVKVAGVVGVNGTT